MPDRASVRATAVQRDAADQVDGAQQLVVRHRVLRRLVRIGRGRGRGGRLVVVLLVGLVGRSLARVARLDLRGLVVGLLGGVRLVLRIGDRTAQVLLAEARALLDGLDRVRLDLDLLLHELLLYLRGRRRMV